jgi:hypothetical protein
VPYMAKGNEELKKELLLLAISAQKSQEENIV